VGADAHLLALLHAAWERTGPLSGELRSWQHHERSQQAFGVAGNRVGGFEMVRHAGGAQPEESECRWLFVSAPDGRYRQELVPAATAHPFVRHPRIEGNDGRRAWSIIDEKLHIHPSRPSELTQRLLDPGWVLTHDLEAAGETTSSGRPVLEVRATARPSRMLQGSAKDFAVERDLVVDAERGFLHSDIALVGGLPYDVLEMRGVQVDTTLDPAAFELQVPPGAEVFDSSDYQPDFRAPWDRHPWRWRLRHPLWRRRI
jgi:hypothetical protein